MASSAVAPWWHTALVVLPIAIASIAGAIQHGLPNANLPWVGYRLSSYLTVLALEWYGVVLIWVFFKHRNVPLSSLVSGSWPNARAFLKDLGIALGFMVVIIPTIGILAFLLGAATNSAIAGLTPKTVLELLVFVALAASAGFAEELVFRGYLTEQFTAWTGNRMAGVVIQAMFFGLAHGFYGKAMLAIMVQGWLLGMLAHWRKSLRPGMLAHGLQDSLGGIVAFFS